MQALRILARGGIEPNNGVAPPPLASHKVKVTFSKSFAPILTILITFYRQ